MMRKNQSLKYTPPEWVEQKQVVQWFKINFPDLLINADVGGVWTRNYAQAMKNKMLGHSNGFPDLAIFEPRGKHYALFIEMKRELGGKVTPEQKQWIDELNARGYTAIVCNGYYEATRAIEKYLSGI